MMYVSERKEVCMNPVGMNVNGYVNYNVAKNQLRDNTQTVSSGNTDTLQAPAFKGGVKVNSKNGLKVLFASVAGALGIGVAAKKVHETINKEPVVGENVKPKDAEILLNQLKDKNGGIESIQRDVDVRENYDITEVRFKDGNSLLFQDIDTEENTLKKLQNSALGYNKSGLFKTYRDNLQYLYGKQMDDISTVIEQPKEQVVIDKADFTTKPSDKDNFYNPYLNYSRQDVAKKLRYGENSMFQNKSVLDRIKYSIEYKLGNENPEPADIRALKLNGYGKENNAYVYYDKKTNLSTIFDSYGSPVAQVAFNTNYQNRGDEIPSDYKLYSFYANDKFRQFK